jgi:hypothetical protein
MFRSPHLSSLLVALGSILSAAHVYAGAFDVRLSASPASPARAVSSQIPSAAFSFYAPQTGSVAAPTEGIEAIKFFRACPNNDGGTVLPNNARIKVVVNDQFGHAIPGIPASDVCVMFNGGTAAQGFSGEGADSVIANSQWNISPSCPDVRCLTADAPTNALGVTYVTFMGADPSNPGVSVRDPSRKWGHYDSELPVYVLGIKLPGRLTTFSSNDSYTLRIKNLDWTGGLDALANQGERVTVNDYNGVVTMMGVSNALSYWKDFDNSGSVNPPDMNLLTNHLNHHCGVPISP